MNHPSQAFLGRVKHCIAFKTYSLTFSWLRAFKTPQRWVWRHVVFFVFLFLFIFCLSHWSPLSMWASIVMALSETCFSPNCVVVYLSSLFTDSARAKRFCRKFFFLYGERSWNISAILVVLHSRNTNNVITVSYEVVLKKNIQVNHKLNTKGWNLWLNVKSPCSSNITCIYKSRAFK